MDKRYSEVDRYLDLISLLEDQSFAASICQFLQEHGDDIPVYTFETSLQLLEKYGHSCFNSKIVEILASNEYKRVLILDYIQKLNVSEYAESLTQMLNHPDISLEECRQILQTLIAWKYAKAYQEVRKFKEVELVQYDPTEEERKEILQLIGEFEQLR